MLDAHSASSLPPFSRTHAPPPRQLDDVQGSGPGPTVVFVCGLHGDESDALRAAPQAVPALQQLRRVLRGRVVFLAGNRQALASGVRFCVDPRVAPSHASEVMHPCGYRRQSTSQRPLVFSRTGPERH